MFCWETKIRKKISEILKVGYTLYVYKMVKAHRLSCPTHLVHPCRSLSNNLCLLSTSRRWKTPFSLGLHLRRSV